MFYADKKGHHYINEIDLFNIAKLDQCGNLYYPVEVDTEFQDLHFPFNRPEDCIDMTLVI